MRISDWSSDVCSSDRAPLLEATTLAPFGYRDTLSYEVAANWKAGLDPQYEGYHVGTVNALTIREISVTPANPFSEFRKMAFAGPHAAGWSRGNAAWRPRADRIVRSSAVQTRGARSEARGVGREGVWRGRARWSPDP